MSIAIEFYDRLVALQFSEIDPQSSAGAEDLVGWHLNNSADKAPDFYGVVRFREQFYRPDVIAGVLDALAVDKAVPDSPTPELPVT